MNLASSLYLLVGLLVGFGVLWLERAWQAGTVDRRTRTYVRVALAILYIAASVWYASVILR